MEHKWLETTWQAIETTYCGTGLIPGLLQMCTEDGEEYVLSVLLEGYHGLMGSA